jgi:bacterioferritin-associated ferredoxin
MISRDNRRIMTFFGTYQVLKAEKLLQKEGIAVEAIAAPRHVSSDCGICIRLARSDEERASRVLASAKMEIGGVYDE